MIEFFARPEDFPPVPTKLLWMIDASDRKEATKMIHDYAKTCVTNRLAEDQARRLEGETERLRGRINADIEDDDDAV